MNIQKVYILAFLGMIAMSANSQDNKEMTDSIHITDSLVVNRDTYDVNIPEFLYKSPEAAAFQRYGEYIANEYTGDPNISIPLYKLKYKDVEVPITLTYDASGIKVEQEASIVGLGWNLMVGGCISYIPAGHVDPRILMSTDEELQQILTYENQNYNIYESNFLEYENGSYHANSSVNEDIADGFGEHDYYMVQLLGRSFMFMYDEITGSFVTIGRGDDVYRIDTGTSLPILNPDDVTWTINDANGFVYTFLPGEMLFSGQYGGTHRSTWNLSSILSPEGTCVTFGYSSGSAINCYTGYYEHYDIVSGDDFSYYPWQTHTYSMADNVSQIVTKYLNSMFSSDQTVSFEYSDRTDYPGAKKLDKITITSAITHQVVKEFRFYYSYFTADEVGGDYMGFPSTNSYSQEDMYRLRLKLLSVGEYAGTDSLTTSFEYNENTHLPLKTSFSKDFWGYFNGRENACSSPLLQSHTFIPTLRWLRPSGLSDSAKVFNGANRYCDKNKLQAAILNKIVYPTKGYTCFKYEPHHFLSSTYYPQASFPSGLKKTVSVYDNNHPQATGTNHRSINLDAHYSGKITVSFQGTLSSLLNNNANISIYRTDNSSGLLQRYDLTLASSYDIAYGNYFTKTMDIDLQAGKYMIVANCPDVLGFPGYSVSTEINIETPMPSGYGRVSTGGGLRIKTIENYNHDGVLQDSVAYVYTDEDGRCSGKLLRPMSFDESIRFIVCYNSPYPGAIFVYDRYDYYVERLKMESTNMPSFSLSVGGGTVGYSMVTKNNYDKNGQLTSSITKQFKNQTPTDYYGKLCCFETLDNGNILSETVKSPDGSFLRRKEYTYSLDSCKYYRCNAVIQDRCVLFTANPDGYFIPSRYKIWLYPYKYEWNNLTSTTDTVFDGSTRLSKTVSYEYSGINHRPVSMTENSSNSAVSYVTEYKYPFDFTDNSSLLMCQAPNYMLNTVIQQSLYSVENGFRTLHKSKRSHYVATTQKYRDNLRGTRTFLPSYTEFALNGGSLTSRLTYYYTQTCDLREVVKDGFDKVVYLWAYNNQYPVAEIKGATYSQVAGWLGSATINNLAQNTTTVSTALASIRSILASKPVLVTTYTYDPLVGITSVTSPNGTKVSYEYDAFGRLSFVKDHEDNVIQQHTYNYKQ